MKKKTVKSIKKCTFEGCKNLKKKVDRISKGDRFCSFHTNRATIGRALGRIYSNMKQRVEGRGAHNRGNWKGKPILPKEVFKTWARNHSIFLGLYKQWTMSNFDIKLAPSVNRINSSKGYTLDNMEWMTNSQNSGLSSTVRKMKQRKEIYNLLGVTFNV
jgi:hypothetical protein